MADIMFKEESYKPNRAFFEVYKKKGCGFLENVYQECLEIEFEIQGIEFVAQHPLKLEYIDAATKCCDFFMAGRRPRRPDSGSPGCFRTQSPVNRRHHII